MRKSCSLQEMSQKKFLENIADPNFFQDDPHLVQVYTATLNEDEFVVKDVEEDSKDEESNRSRRDKFL